MKKSIVGIVGAAGLAIAGSASAQTFNGTGFAIPDNNVAGITSTTGATVGALPTIDTVTVSMTFSPVHTWGGDITAILSYSGGGSVTFINRIGSTTALGVGDSSDLAGPYVFQDGGASIWTAAAAAGAAVAIPAGTYEPHTRSATFAYEASSFNSVFGGLSSSGEWTLFVSDGAGGDTGGVSAWSVTITTVPTPGAMALLGLGGLVATRRRRA